MNCMGLSMFSGSDIAPFVQAYGSSLTDALHDLITNRFKWDLLSIDAMDRGQEITWNMTFLVTQGSELQDPYIDFEWSCVRKDQMKLSSKKCYEHSVPLHCHCSSDIKWLPD